IKEVLYRYTAHRGKSLNSQAMVANAWHHRSDALSSIGAAIGIGGAIMLGNHWAVLDPIASVVVGCMLVKVAVGLLRNSIGELTECSLPSDTEQEILDIIHSLPEVSDTHNLRTRHIGERTAIECHVRMDGNMPLMQAHDLASTIEQRLKDRFGPTTHVSIHMEPQKS
ncbi:MAG: cation transporter, partial [Muribaculaceae bacterium]|nr:cation transporter [Muribaculaceae bacterium]